jgi:Protein of unknown function (DUF1571)
MPAQQSTGEARADRVLLLRCSPAAVVGFSAALTFAYVTARGGDSGDMPVRSESASAAATVEKPRSPKKATLNTPAGSAAPARDAKTRTRVVLARDASSVARPTVPAASKTSATGSEALQDESPIARAQRVIADCQSRYEAVNDYTCTFYKRERIDGQLTELYIMQMKFRVNPHSIYFRFQQPAQGREAIYIAGRNGGKILAHDVGFNKLLAGTLQLDPRGARAMDNCRHPITQAGIGPLLDTLGRRWAIELNPEESVLTFRDDAFVGPHRCTMVESTHAKRQDHFLYYRVRVFIDQNMGLPVRFEAYDWPKTAHEPAVLAEEYSYMNLKLNVGLHDIDFDTTNPQYSFGRF